MEERERRERAGVNAVVSSWPAARGLTCGEGLACGIFLWLTGQMGGMMEVFFFFGVKWSRKKWRMEEKEMEEKQAQRRGGEKTKCSALFSFCWFFTVVLQFFVLGSLFSL